MYRKFKIEYKDIETGLGETLHIETFLPFIYLDPSI